ncbi:hypothetical protein P9705_001259 [Enterococcus faecalis]|nr:hypothetical protein [Enterococcus faecalis]
MEGKKRKVPKYKTAGSSKDEQKTRQKNYYDSLESRMEEFDMGMRPHDRMIYEQMNHCSRKDGRYTK